MALIEDLPLREDHLVLGPPGSGKTNILLRRAQFVRTQRMTNVRVLTFARALVEFVRTGCVDNQGREIFPSACVTTLESWERDIFRQHGVSPPTEMPENFMERKNLLAKKAAELVKEKRIPKYHALFVDEAQDLTEEEVKLIAAWSDVRFFVGDDRQQIYGQRRGFDAVQALVPRNNTHKLQFHYRLAPEICSAADQIMVAQGSGKLSETEHYSGPRPGRVSVNGPFPREDQLSNLIERLRDQVRAYSDLIGAGDYLGIIVARREDREAVFNYLETQEELKGKSQVVRARSSAEDEHIPTIRSDRPICILTVKGCKGLEFRAVHWLFCEELSSYHKSEHYYTVVTRAKTSLDLYYEDCLPQELAGAAPPRSGGIWG